MYTESYRDCVHPEYWEEEKKEDSDYWEEKIIETEEDPDYMPNFFTKNHYLKIKISKK
jgi:hypothetical protein